MNPRLLKAPANHGEVLAVPAVDNIPVLVDANRKSLDAHFGELRRLARRDLHIADDVPIIITGHQPELFHPGVWVKNFAANGLARKLGGHAINLIVDTDTVKSTSIRLPQINRAVTLEHLSFDDFGGESPYESTPVHNEALFRSFTDRLAAATEEWPFRPVITEPSIARETAEMFDATTSLGHSLAAIRQNLEAAWDCENLEFPVSAMSQFDSFREFATLIINDAARFRESYNRAIRDYRTVNKLKSRNHPAPELEANELPFWTMIDGTRQRTFKVDDISAVRPKALILTLYARLILGDFFLHGLGGGKYDAVTDSIIRNYFGIEPPAYQMLTATLHLPFEPVNSKDQPANRIRQLRRRVIWNPQDYLEDVWQQEAAIDAELFAQIPEGPDHNRQLFLVGRQCLARVQNRYRDRLDRELQALDQHLANRLAFESAFAILTRRDYAWVLYPESMLKPYLTRFLSNT
ncbi:hypothetical protein BH11PLA2_BH11PLA2_06640 [soil metagenome]